MRQIFASQYGTACIQLHEGDDFDEVIEFAKEQGAIYEEEPNDWVYVFEFPGRFPELYTNRALKGSFPIKGATYKKNRKLRKEQND